MCSGDNMVTTPFRKPYCVHPSTSTYLRLSRCKSEPFISMPLISNRFRLLTGAMSFARVFTCPHQGMVAPLVSDCPSLRYFQHELRPSRSIAARATSSSTISYFKINSSNCVLCCVIGRQCVVHTKKGRGNVRCESKKLHFYI